MHLFTYQRQKQHRFILRKNKTAIRAHRRKMIYSLHTFIIIGSINTKPTLKIKVKNKDKFIIKKKEKKKKQLNTKINIKLTDISTKISKKEKK